MQINAIKINKYSSKRFLSSFCIIIIQNIFKPILPNDSRFHLTLRKVNTFHKIHNGFFKKLFKIFDFSLRNMFPNWKIYFFISV